MENRRAGYRAKGNDDLGSRRETPTPSPMIFAGMKAQPLVSQTGERTGIAVCGRYCIASEDNIEELNRIIEEINRKTSFAEYAGKMKLGPIAPSDIAPVVANSVSRVPHSYPMRWGFTRPDGKGLIINARSETAQERIMFRKPLLERRCLIPATCYFEWEKRGKERIPYAIRTQDGGLMYMAGFYRYEAGGALPAVVILTCTPAEEIAFIHDRMPVILPRALQAQWLRTDMDILSVLNAPRERMQAQPVS